MCTTLNKIRDKSPCVDGWAKLLKYLGKTQADDAPLSIKTVLESNGLDDALWCLRAVEGRDKEIRLLAVKYARAVQHLMTPQSVQLLDVTEAYANGQATREELDQAKGAARNSVSAAAAWATWGAADDAAWAADAAAASAADAAWAAWAAWAAQDATWGAADDAAWAADAAAASAAWAARATSRDAADAADAAWVATKAQQTQDLIELCNQLERTTGT